MSDTRFNGIVKIASLSLQTDSETLKHRFQAMAMQIEQIIENSTNEEGDKSSAMRTLTLKEITMPNLVTVITERNEEFKQKTIDEKARMVSSLVYLALPELWRHDSKISAEINKWNQDTPTWGQIRSLELWKLLKFKKIRPNSTQGLPYTNTFHRIYTVTKGLIYLDTGKKSYYKHNMLWSWLMEKADYEIIMILS